MDSLLQKKSPTELLAYQTELLEQILAAQKQISVMQIKFDEAQIAWLKSIDNRTSQQLGYLKNINIVATILGILLILSFCGGVASIFGSF